MTVRLELRPEVEENLAAQARARGVPLVDYLQRVIEELALAETAPQPSPRDIEAILNRLADMGTNLPHLPSSAFTRESIYSSHD